MLPEAVRPGASRRANVPVIQSLRGIAVLMVLLFHLASIEAKYGQGYQVMPGASLIGLAGVDLFFVISGFIMVTVTRDIAPGWASIRNFLIHRCVRIYPLYWFYSLLVLATLLWRPDMVNTSVAGQVDLLASFLLWPADSLPLLMVGWTLVHEMYFYLVFALLLALPGQLRPLSLAFWAAAIVAMQTLAAPVSAVASLVTHPLTLEFIAGCAVALALHARPPLTGRWLPVLALIAWALGYAALSRSGLAASPTGWARVLAYGLPAALTVYALVAQAHTRGLRLPAWLEHIGDASYSIYLSHVLILSALGRLWQLAPGFAGVWLNVLALTLLCTATVGIGILAYRYLERPLLAWLRGRLPA